MVRFSFLTTGVLLYMVHEVKLQSTSAKDVIMNAVLSNFGNAGVPFPLPFADDRTRQMPPDILNLGESFFLSRLRQGDRNALLHLNQLHQSVDTPASLLNGLLHLVRQPNARRGSNLFETLHTIAVARGLIPNTHAFVFRRPEGIAAMNVENNIRNESGAAVTEQFGNLTSKTTRIRELSRIQQQIKDTMRKGVVFDNVTIEENRPNNTGDGTQLNSSNIDLFLPALRESSLEARLNRRQHELNQFVQNDVGSRVNGSSGRLWSILTEQNNVNNGSLNVSPNEIDIVSESAAVTAKTTYSTVKSKDKMTSLPSTPKTLNNGFNGKISVSTPFLSQRIGRIQVQPFNLPDETTLKRKGNGGLRRQHNQVILDLPEDLTLNNKSVIVEDNGFNSGRPMEIDVFPHSTTKNKSQREFMLQEVGELDLKPKNVTYQYVGDINFSVSSPKQVKLKVSETNIGERKQFLMQVKGDSGDLDNTVLIHRLDPANLLPAEILRVHGNGETRLVTKEKVVIERLGFVKFKPTQPQGLDVRSYKLDAITVPVLRVEAVRKDFIIADRTTSKSERAKNNTKHPFPETVLQFVGDLSKRPKGFSSWPPNAQETDSSVLQSPVPKQVKGIKDNNQSDAFLSLPSTSNKAAKATVSKKFKNSETKETENIHLESKGRLVTVVNLMLNDTKKTASIESKVCKEGLL